MSVSKVLCAIGCLACIVCAAIFYGLKAAGFVALATLLEAIIFAMEFRQMEEEYFEECENCEYVEYKRAMEDDGK